MQLRYPHSWAERCPAFSQGVFFVPPHYFEHHASLFPGWRSLFHRAAPVWIEYCSGNGSWIIEKAKQHPDKNWVAVEKKFERLQKIWKQREGAALNNLFLVCGEAWTFTHHYVETESVAGICINFPDPWPKQKHAKHRLIQDAFVEELVRITTVGATLTLVTDDLNYRDQIVQTCIKHHRLISLHPPLFFALEHEGYGTSFFDALWRKKGKTIYYIELKKIGAEGFEPPTHYSQSSCASQTALCSD